MPERLPAPSAAAELKTTAPGAQTLVRGLSIISAVAEGKQSLGEISTYLGLTRSTAHRLASTLVDLRYLTADQNARYALGPKLLELGYVTRQQLPLTRVARAHLQTLARETEDTVHLGCLDGMRALYLEKVPGQRRVEVSSRIGELQPVRSTGLGKALILDETEERWREFYEFEDRHGNSYSVGWPDWLSRMREYAKKGVALDLEENEDRIRCVAAPVRDASRAIIGAVSLSSAAQYMDERRMDQLRTTVANCARRISLEMGWS